MNLADARVDKAKGVVICSTVNPSQYQSHFPEGLYHLYDYAFYFFDVMTNVARRIETYFAGDKGN